MTSNSPLSDVLRVALAQMRSVPDVDANRAVMRDTVARAAAEGARLVAFPENAPFLGPVPGRVATAEPLHGRQIEAMQDAATRHGIWVLVGSFAEATETPGKTANTAVMIDPSGRIAATYRKMHLFDVAVAGDTVFAESASTCPGPAEAVVTEVEGWRVGLSICYDLRFPELYRTMAARGVDLICVPAAFTFRTGAAGHWEILLRARAIENLAWVVAPAQTGIHHPGRESWGHTMVVDPWGGRRGALGFEPGLLVCDLDRNEVRGARERIPALGHRRIGVDGAG